MYRVCCFLVGVAVSAVTVGSAWAAEKPAPLDENRVKEWAAMLPEKPRGVGPTIADRQAWKTVADAAKYQDAVKSAEQLLSQPIPDLTDDLMLDYSRTGNRSRCEKVIRERRGRINSLVLAECIENSGRFLPAIETAIRATCTDKMWMYPAHDSATQSNFRGELVEIDLFAAEAAWNLATARYWLGDKLSPEVRKLIDDELERRIFTPFTKIVTTGQPKMWWLIGTNNWNAVCMAGVIGTAMANIESRKRRAFFAAAAERYIQYFLKGMTPDGYCSEGVGYWNYGFGHYVMLAETLKQATAGKVDMMDSDHVRQIAMYSRRIEILPGVYPAFSDSDPTGQPDTQIMAFLSRRYGWGLKDVEAKGLGLTQGRARSFSLGLYGFPNSATMTPSVTTAVSPAALRDHFADAGILVCRPAPGSSHALGAAFKGGHNADNPHNHDQLDVGSYVVALGHATPLVDPGAEVYTKRTFSDRRFDSNLLNSFGHPVPRVAGRLQEMSREAVAKVVKTDFTDASDTLVLDLKSAYKVPELKKLERTFVFSRAGAGKLTVSDAVEFDSPQKFETALITFGKWKQLGPNQLQVEDGAEHILVDINTEGNAFQITPEEIHEQTRNGRTPTRLGLELAKPVARATITLTITP